MVDFMLCELYLNFKKWYGTSLVAQGLRVQLTMQGTRIGKKSTLHRVTKPTHHKC